jgi:glutamyl-tRNA synthetase
VENFQKGSLQIANPVFNRQKLDWFNGYYIRQKTDDELVQLIKPFVSKNADLGLIGKTIPLIKERINKLSEYRSLAEFFFEEPKIKKELFDENAREQLPVALSVLEEMTDWKKEKLVEALQKLVKEKSWNTGEFFMNFRIAITGSKITPPITDSIEILGRQKTLKRLRRVISLIKN